MIKSINKKNMENKEMTITTCCTTTFTPEEMIVMGIKPRKLPSKFRKFINNTIYKWRRIKDILLNRDEYDDY